MKKIILIILLVFNHVAYGELLLELPAVCDGVWDNKTPSQQNAANVMSVAYKGASVVVGRCFGWTNFNEGSIWYEITKDFKVHGLNVETKEYLGNWPLTTPATCDGTNIDCEEPWWTGRWNEQEFLEPLLKERFKDNSGGEILVMDDGLGCLNKSPLRYGDIDKDTKDELVLFLNDNLLIFSPEKQKTIFLSLYNLLGDHTTLEETIDQHGFPNPTFPQHVSKIASNSGAAFVNSAQVIEPSYKAYAKHYVQDFSNDQKSDLVVWRKFYQSRLQGDSVKGYEKVSDTYLHYSKVDGEYQLQTDTAPETIQGWLTSKNLTWQSGFPSKSECAGQEGQLIPEMHDPLLNDPDVLK
jgi:hypothetical protein